MTVEDIISGESEYIEFKREVDSFVLKELEFEGANRCFDQTYAAPEESVTEDEINDLCNRMYQYAVEHCKSKEAAEGIHRLTRQNFLRQPFNVLYLREQIGMCLSTGRNMMGIL